MHVALVGGTLWGNRGAEAMVETTIGLISERDPGVEFTVLSYFPDEDRTLVDDERVQIASATPAAMVVDCLLAAVVRVLQLVGVRLPDRLLPGSLAAVRRADCLLDVSGIAFHDGRLAVVVYHLVKRLAGVRVAGAGRPTLTSAGAVREPGQQGRRPLDASTDADDVRPGRQVRSLRPESRDPARTLVAGARSCFRIS